MGLCLSCESKRNPVPPSPMMAKKWKFSTTTSSEHRGPDRLTEIASLSSQQGRTAMLVWGKYGSKREDALVNFTMRKFGSTTQDCDDVLHPVVKRVRNFLPPKLSQQYWEVKILGETNSQAKTKDSDCVLNLVKNGQDLTIGNIGLSGAVLGMRDENNAFVPVMNVEQDDFVVLVPSGVWDELWNRDVQAIVDRSPTRLCAARAVVNAAHNGWRRKNKVDDDDECAVICLFLDSPQESDIVEMRTKTGLHVCSRPVLFVERVWL